MEVQDQHPPQLFKSGLADPCNTNYTRISTTLLAFVLSFTDTTALDICLPMPDGSCFFFTV